MADLTTIDEPARPDPEAAVGDSRPSWSVWWPPEWRSVASVAIVLVAFVLPLRGLFRFQGPPMEEGFMLVFPELVLNGEIPNRDFLHLYGPGSLWALAGFFKVFGVSLASERAFGLLQLGGIVFGVMALARPWGRKAATASGLIGVLITTTAIGLTALAWNGAVALGVIGLWVGLRARRWLAAEAPGLSADDLDRRVQRLLLGSGVLAALGLLFRPDLIIGIVLGYGALLWGLERRRILQWATGLAVAVVGYLIQIVTAGPGHSLQGMVLDPVFRLRPGRSLPLPKWDHFDGALQQVAALRVPGWSLPALSAPQQTFIWFFMLPVLILLTIGTGVWRLRREPGAWRPRVLLVVGLFSLGIMPQALQRPDSTHLAWVSCVPLLFLPATIAELWRHLAPRPVRRHAGLAAAGVGLVLLLAVIPFFTFRTYLDLTNQSMGREVYGNGVHHAGRVFYLGKADYADDAQDLVEYLGERAKPGERLFVGTDDMRKTPYSDAYLYFLLPDLVPGTYYIEMDPGMANREGSGLAGDVASSDWLVLSRLWPAVWNEPNTSRELMSDEANEAVRKGFCKVRDFGMSFELYRRCGAPSATEGS